MEHTIINQLYKYYWFFFSHLEYKNRNILKYLFEIQRFIKFYFIFILKKSLPKIYHI